jgi:phosphoenolpyruvate carboxykinase (ATP)
MAQELTHWLNSLGITQHKKVLHNPDRSHLVTEALENHEGQLTQAGALGVITTPYTGRSPNDKFIVHHQKGLDLWWGNVNQKISPEAFGSLKKRITAYLSNRKLYVVDCHIGADINYQLSIRVVAEYAWQALVVQNLFIYDGTPLAAEPDLTILATPTFKTTPELDEVNSDAAIAIDLLERMVLITGSAYAGEIKKSAFTVMNALLPESGVLPMHCSANMGKDGDVALYFGLSGTGKTTLSSTPERRLIGDDEHGWGKNGIFNFEGGCYAKTIRLDPEQEPVIWQAANQYGTVLENVFISPEDRQVDFSDARFTENTRAAYPLCQVKNIVPSGEAGHPKNVFFLTADAFGVMPPIAKLDRDQAIYYFLSGYTSKIAGTELSLSKVPVATFSTCFGEPFLPLKPNIYSDLLKEKISAHNAQVWLINTGWTAGDYNTGHRMPLPYTRRMVNWILSDEHRKADFHPDPVFKILVPNEIDGIPSELLTPEKTWEDKETFNRIAKQLMIDFEKNFGKFKAFL